MPEGNLALAQAVVYLAIAPKSNALYTAYGAVKRMWSDRGRAGSAAPAQRSDAADEELGYGEGYKYAHDIGKTRSRHAVPAGQSEGQRLLRPTKEGVEKRIRERMEQMRRERVTSSKEESGGQE